MLYGAPTARRSDARRNRAAIVEAASAVLTGTGQIALMPEVARRAGIGQATLYRHFPDRYALAAAVIDHHLRELERCAATTPFRVLLHEVLRRQIMMRPLVVLAQRLDPVTLRRYQDQLTAALAGPMRRDQARGLVRDDLVPHDVMLLVTMLQGVGDEAADRSVDLMLDGLFRTR
ncbi:TetR/AcrR family transcriptional regulator [Actinoplanes sp. NPDC051494]|uniref:TetR/AcrR family transcriptional regulator n=1 Tax=Actinoplanes sp. NPDC051494 TaxID=3363907 RepID=UPI0037873D1C